MKFFSLDISVTTITNHHVSHHHPDLAVDVVVGVGAVGERWGELGRTDRLRPSKHRVAGVGGSRELVLVKDLFQTFESQPF